MNVAKRVGANVAAHRERVGISQEELAWRAGLHRTAIGLLERGERVPRVDTLLKLAGAMDAAPADLLSGVVWEPGDVRYGRFTPR